MSRNALRDYVVGSDAPLFVGRDVELQRVEQLLDPAGAARVLIVHGPGGIGKSALLRAAHRRAEERGRTVQTFDGRALASALHDLADMLTPDDDATEPLIIIDEIESLGAGFVAVREMLLTVLPSDARVIVAGRVRPDRAWLAGALEGMTLEIALTPLADADSRALLARRGVEDGSRQESILDWAQGSPLALTLATTSHRESPLSAADELDDRLIQYLAGSEIDGIDQEVLEVAALTWAVDSRLLASALPGRSTRGALADLLALSVVEPIGHRAVLHPLLAQAIATRLRADRPLHFRALRARIANHLTARALQGDPQALLELTDLIEDPNVRVGAGLHASRTHSAAGVRPDDPAIARLVDELGHTEWLVQLRPWLEGLPEFGIVIREAGGALAGVVAYVPGDRLPPWASDEPAVAAILDHMVRNGIDPARTLIGIAPHTPEPGNPNLAEIIRVANTVIVLRSGIVNPRYLYGPFWHDHTVPEAFLTSMGYGRIGELDRVIDEVPVSTWLADFGTTGLVGLIDAMVAAENGTASAQASTETISLLAALRDYRDDRAMAARDPGGSPEAARAMVREALAAEFGEDAADAKLRRILELTYIEPGLGEQAILSRLHLSRATYYRHLRAARERLVSG